MLEISVVNTFSTSQGLGLTVTLTPTLTSVSFGVRQHDFWSFDICGTLFLQPTILGPIDSYVRRVLKAVSVTLKK